MSNGEVKHEQELREQWQKAHEGVHFYEQQALQLAKVEVDRRLGEMNQLREQITTERGAYVERAYYDEQHAGLRDTIFTKLDALREGMDARLKVLEQGKSNLEGRLWMMGAAISAIVVLLNLILRYVGK